MLCSSHGIENKQTFCLFVNYFNYKFFFLYLQLQNKRGLMIKFSLGNQRVESVGAVRKCMLFQRDPEIQPDPMPFLLKVL